MQVGDLVKGRGLFDDRLGIVLSVVSKTKMDKYLLIQWNGEILESCNSRLLEVVNENR